MAGNRAQGTGSCPSFAPRPVQERYGRAGAEQEELLPGSSWARAAARQCRRAWGADDLRPSPDVLWRIGDRCRRVSTSWPPATERPRAGRPDHAQRGYGAVDQVGTCSFHYRVADQPLVAAEGVQIESPFDAPAGGVADRTPSESLETVDWSPLAGTVRRSFPNPATHRPKRLLSCRGPTSTAIQSARGIEEWGRPGTVPYSR